jgi:hypothetical protein
MSDPELVAYYAGLIRQQVPGWRAPATPPRPGDEEILDDDLLLGEEAAARVREELASPFAW